MENRGNNTAKKKVTNAFSCRKMFLVVFLPPNHPYYHPLLISAPFHFSLFFPGPPPKSLTLSWTLLCSILVDSHRVVGYTW